MQNTGQGISYRFTDEQKKFVVDTVQRLRTTTGVKVEVAFGLVKGYNAYEVILHNHGHVRESGIAIVQSMQTDSGGIAFSVRAYDGGTIGPQSSYAVFQEAVVFADVFVRNVIEKIEITPSQTPSNDPTNEPLSPSDLRSIFAFSESLGRIAQVPCSTEMKILAPNAVTIGFFMMHEETSILMGTMVVTLASAGGIVASVRSFNNIPVIQESFFPSVDDALSAARHYFSNIAETMKKIKTKKTLFDRFRGFAGL